MHTFYLSYYHFNVCFITFLIHLILEVIHIEFSLHYLFHDIGFLAFSLLFKMGPSINLMLKLSQLRLHFILNLHSQFMRLTNLQLNLARLLINDFLNFFYKVFLTFYLYIAFLYKLMELVKLHFICLR